MSGEYRVSLAAGSAAVPGSPFRVTCRPPRACEQQSRIDLRGAQVRCVLGTAANLSTHRLPKEVGYATVAVESEQLPRYASPAFADCKGNPIAAQQEQSLLAHVRACQN